MKKIAWWKIAVIVLLGLAVIGVMQLKTKEAATDHINQRTVTTPPVSDEAPAPEPAKDTAATPSTSEPIANSPATASKTTAGGTGKATTNTTSTVMPTPVKAAPVKKVTFIELGADKCIPCKLMQPVMEELRNAYPTTLKVVFYDIWKDPTMGDKYGVQTIPTQVLLDGDGKEIFRHTGFWPKEEIVAKYKELGINL